MVETSSHDAEAAMEGRRILILYGTETGNSQDRAEELGRLCERLRFHTLVEEMNDVKLNELLHDYSLVIFVTSTTGQGNFPADSLRFWKSLRRAKLPPRCLASLRFTTFGLGDSSYSKFNWAARQLHSRLQQLGAQEAFPRGEADERHDNGIDSIYQPWYQDLKTYLLTAFPLPASVQPIPDSEPLPPKYVLRLAEDMGHGSEFNKMSGNDLEAEAEKWFLENKEKNAALSHTERPRTEREQFEEDWERQKERGDIPYLARQDETHSNVVLGGKQVDTLDASNILKDGVDKYLLKPRDLGRRLLPPPLLLPIPQGWDAIVQQNERLTPPRHWQDVRLIELDIPIPEGTTKELMVSPGDTVVIFPKNYPEDVQNLIELMGWEDVADMVVDLGPGPPWKSAGKPGLNLPLRRGLYPVPGSTLRDLLTHNFDITAVPMRSFIEKISHFAGELKQKEKLRDLLLPQNTQEFYDFTSRPRRTILELLADFDSVKIPWNNVADLFPVIRGREYSIANAAKSLMHLKPGTISFQILAALVEYKTIIRKPRQGLCSRYLKSLRAGTAIRVTVKEGNPPPLGPEAAKRPLIAIATGTGIAPIRSLIYHRLCCPVNSATLLFFGCRNKDADFYFMTEWLRIPWLMVVPAFSRDAPLDERTDLGGYTLADRYSIEGTTKSGSGLGPIDASSTGMLSFDYDRGKDYVQNSIRRAAPHICTMLREGAFICLCGSSGRMPKSVLQALVDTAVIGGLCATKEEAEQLFDQKNPNGVVVWQETW